MTLTESDRAFVLHKSRQVMEATVSNLHAAASIPYALGAWPNRRRGTMVCVGAGPSLAATGPHLAAMRADGALICTVNTAFSAVARFVEVDVVLAREVVDVSSHLDYSAGLRVLDIGASSAVWAQALSMGECAWFVPGCNQTFELAASLGVRPLFGGTAAMTALVALCEQWGAAEIVLVGVDLALAPSGDAYAAGSAFAGMRAQIDAAGVATHGGTGFECKRTQHASGGVHAPPSVEPTFEVEAWGGGTVRTTAAWIDQIPWLAEFARRHPDIACVDMTGAGARKAGWDEEAASAWEPFGERASMYDIHDSWLAAPDVARARARLIVEADMVSSLAATVLDPDGAVACVPGYLAGSDLVDAMAARDLTLGKESTASMLAKVRHAYGTAFPSAAMRVRELCEPATRPA